MRRYTLEEIFNLANEVHNNFYDYKNVDFKGMSEKVDIVCPKHGPFQQRMSHHIHRKHGCMKCAKERMSEYWMHSTEDFIEKAVSTHGTKYDYSKTEYNGVFKKVKIICSEHGEFEQIADAHIRGKGCWKCGGSFPMTTVDFITKANIIHDNFYNYCKTEYKNSSTNVIITCPDHGDFKQSPSSHLGGSACKKCNGNISKGETEWLNNLGVGIRQHEIYVGDMRCVVDGYDQKTNTVYEYHGDFWHGNPKIYNENFINTKNNLSMGELYNNTIKRENLIKSAGYNLIVMWERDWMNSKNV